MTAEELKAAVREYADEHLPGWKGASVMILVDSPAECDTETLIVRPVNESEE